MAQLFADQSAIAIENARSRARRSTENAGSHSAGSSGDIAGDKLGKKPPQMLAILAFQTVDESDTELKIVGATLAACYAKRGDQKQAQEAASRFRESFSTPEHRYHVQTRPFRRHADMRKLRGGLQSAGLSDIWPSQPEDELADAHADTRHQDFSASS